MDKNLLKEYVTSGWRGTWSFGALLYVLGIIVYCMFLIAHNLVIFPGYMEDEVTLMEGEIFYHYHTEEAYCVGITISMWWLVWDGLIEGDEEDREEELDYLWLDIEDLS